MLQPMDSNFKNKDYRMTTKYKKADNKKEPVFMTLLFHQNTFRAFDSNFIFSENGKNLV